MHWLVLGVVVAVFAHDAEVRRGLISNCIVRWAAYLLPKNERARYIEEWSADLLDTPGALSRLLVAFDLFRAGAGVRVQLVEDGLSVGVNRVSTASDPQRCNPMNAVAAPASAQSLSLSDSTTGMPARLSIGVVLAIVVTTGLLWVMTYLISTTGDTLDPVSPKHWVDIFRIEREPEPVIPPRITLTKQEPPPAFTLRGQFSSDTGSVKIPMTELSPTDIPRDDESSAYAFNEGDLLELVVVRPVYPPRLEARGLEGSCTVQYTVTRQGTVIDPVIVDSLCTHSLFGRASINAVLKFRYKPRVIDGVAVDVPGQMKKFTYVMK